MRWEVTPSSSVFLRRSAEPPSFVLLPWLLAGVVCDAFVDVYTRWRLQDEFRDDLLQTETHAVILADALHRQNLITPPTERQSSSSPKWLKKGGESTPQASRNPTAEEEEMTLSKRRVTTLFEHCRSSPSPDGRGRWLERSGSSSARLQTFMRAASHNSGSPGGRSEGILSSSDDCKSSSEPREPVGGGGTAIVGDPKNCRPSGRPQPRMGIHAFGRAILPFAFSPVH